MLRRDVVATPLLIAAMAGPERIASFFVMAVATPPEEVQPLVIES